MLAKMTTTRHDYKDFYNTFQHTCGKRYIKRSPIYFTIYNTFLDTFPQKLTVTVEDLSVDVDTLWENAFVTTQIDRLAVLCYNQYRQLSVVR